MLLSSTLEIKSRLRFITWAGGQYSLVQLEQLFLLHTILTLKAIDQLYHANRTAFVELCAPHNQASLYIRKGLERHFIFCDFPNMKFNRVSYLQHATNNELIETFLEFVILIYE